MGYESREPLLILLLILSSRLHLGPSSSSCSTIFEENRTASQGTAQHTQGTGTGTRYTQASAVSCLVKIVHLRLALALACPVHSNPSTQLCSAHLDRRHASVKCNTCSTSAVGSSTTSQHIHFSSTSTLSSFLLALAFSTSRHAEHALGTVASYELHCTKQLHARRLHNTTSIESTPL